MTGSSDQELRLAGRIEGDQHILPIRVYFEDTDFSGIVYHANYLRYCERGRSDFLRLLGVHHAALYAGEIGGEQLAFAVKHMEIDFVRPAKIDDVLHVVTSTQTITGAALHLEQTVMRGDDVLFKALVTAALLNAAGKPIRLPAEIRDKLDTVPAKA